MGKSITKELELLFICAPPKTLRKSVNSLFYSYMINQETLPNNYRHIAEDVFMLIDFLEKAEELRKK